MPDSFIVTHDQTLTINGPSAGVLQNDYGYDDSTGMSVSGSGLTASQVSGPSHGTLSFDSDGTFVYTPDASFTGSDSFTYAAAVGGASATASVTLNVGSMGGTTGGNTGGSMGGGTGGTNGSTGYGSAGGTSGSMPYGSGGGWTGNPPPDCPPFNPGGSASGTVGVSAVVPSTAEGSSTPGEFKITRSNGVGSLTVAYEVGGTATGGVDYTALGGSVTFAEGMTEIVLPVNSTADNIDDMNETVIVNLVSDPAHYSLGMSTATVTITAPNSPPELSNLHFALTSLAYGTGTGTLTGTLNDGSYMSGYSIQIDNNPGDGVETVNSTAWVGGPNADFTTWLSLPVGTATILVRAAEMDMNGAVLHSGWMSVPVNAVNAPPVFDDQPTPPNDPLLPAAPGPGPGALPFRPQFTATVPENTTGPVLTVTAHDNDPGDYVRSYSLANDPTGLFSINPQTGQITLNQSIDYEQLTADGSPPVITLVVCAEDTNGGTAEADVAVTVTDVDEAPTDIALSHASITENQPADSIVGTFETTDPDVLDEFAYTLVAGAGSDDNDSFTIDGEGNLHASASFSYGAKNEYSIRVRSTDGGGLWIEESFLISVKIIDWGSLSGGATEPGKISFAFDVVLPPGHTGTFAIDVNNDGEFDLTQQYDAVYQGLLIEDADVIGLLGPQVHDGEYQATLQVTMDSGYAESRAFAITVDHAPPEVTAVVIGDVSAGAPCELAISTVTFGTTTQSITVDWGDGAETIVNDVADASLQHTYQSIGDYEIRIIADDGKAVTSETLYVSPNGHLLPQIVAMHATVHDDHSATIHVDAVDADGHPIDPTQIQWDLNCRGAFDIAGETVDAPPSEWHTGRIKVTDDLGRTTYGEFCFDGSHPIGQTPVVPNVAGQPVANPVPDWETTYLLLYGEEGAAFLRAFKATGGTIETGSYWYSSSTTTPKNKIWLDTTTGSLGYERPRTDLAADLAAELYKLSGQTASNMRGYFTTALGEPGTEDSDIAWKGLRGSYQSAIQQGGKTAALLADAYVKGLTIFNTPLDIVVTVHDVGTAASKAEAFSAAIGLMGPLSVAAKGANLTFKPVVLKVAKETGATIRIVTIQPADIPLWVAAKKYADLVNSNTWDEWTQVGKFKEAEQSTIRNIARDMGLIPNIPVDPITHYADFSSVAIAIPSITHPKNIVTLPEVAADGKNLWKAGYDKHFEYLNAKYFNGTQPKGTTWHHLEHSGQMQLVPAGIHKATSHHGGMSKGHWGYVKR